MFITSISPNGVVTNLNLLALAAWRLELIGDAKGRLGIGIRYVMPPTTTFAFIAAIETGAEADVVNEIAKKGLTRGDFLRDKEVLIESLGMLNNAVGLKPKVIDEVVKDAPQLVDVYYKLLDGLKTGEAQSGTFIDWRWQIRPNIHGLDCTKEKADDKIITETAGVVEKTQTDDTA